jgi:hypothetical protein
MDEFALGDFEATTNVPSQSGNLLKSVAELQHILIGLGWKATTIPRPGAKDFGLYGPKTAGAWSKSSSDRKLNPTFQRASATEAYVDPKTDSTLLAASGVKTQPKAQPAAQIKQTKQPTTATPQVAAGEAIKPTDELFQILYSLGWTT